MFQIPATIEVSSADITRAWIQTLLCAGDFERRFLFTAVLLLGLMLGPWTLTSHQR